MKKVKNLLQFITFAIVVSLVMFSCVKDDHDTPESNPIPVGDTITVAELKDLYDLTGDDYVFDYDVSLFATCTMDDKSGNIYKTMYVQDETGGIALHLDNAGGLYQGDYIRLQLNGLKIGTYSELYQIDAIDGNGFTLDQYLTKIQTLVDIEPQVVTINDIKTNSALQGKLIKLENVQFVFGDTAATYADAVNEESRDLRIQDEGSDEVIIRTSGYANFADQKVPDGSGSLIAIVGQYNSTMQLYIRTTDEVVMENERFDVGILPIDYFGGSATFFPYSVTGAQKWEYSDQFSCAVMTGYDGSRFANEDWMISTALDFTGKSGVTLDFRHCIGYGYTTVWDDLTVLVSTDYTGEGNPSSATWTPVSFTAPAYNSFWTWTNGDADISAYDGESTVYIAFKYVCNTTNAATWEVDDVSLSESTK